MNFVEINRFFEMLHDKSKAVGITKIFESIDKYYEDKEGNKIKSSTFSNKLNPNIEGHKLNTEELIFILLELKKSDDHGVVLKEFMSIFGMRVEYIIPKVQIKEHDYVSFMDTWMKFNKEHSDVQIALNSALEDHKISSNELKDIKAEIEGQVAALSDLRIALDSVCGKQLA